MIEGARRRASRTDARDDEHAAYSAMCTSYRRARRAHRGGQ
jgi:hypothetical protein